MDVAASAATAQTADRALQILIDGLGMPDPDEPLPPGPWDPVIRAIDMSALFPTWHDDDVAARPFPEPWRALGLAAGPQPDPWRAVDPYGSLASPWRGVVLEVIRRRHPEVNDAIGGWRGGWSRVALNPQPLPPRWAFAVAAASQMVARVEMITDLAQAGVTGEGAARLVAHYVDDLCPTPWWWRWPGPRPRPEWLFAEIDAADLTVVASVLSSASRLVADTDLAGALAGQAGRLAEESVSRLG